MCIAPTSADPVPAATTSEPVVLHPANPTAPNMPMTVIATDVMGTFEPAFMWFMIVYLSCVTARCLP
jgi:hypothetical protein